MSSALWEAKWGQEPRLGATSVQYPGAARGHQNIRHTILRRHRQHSHGKLGQIMNSAQVLLSLQLVAGAGSCFDRKSDIPCQVRCIVMNEIDIYQV